VTATELLVEAVAHREEGRSAEARTFAADALRAAAGDDARSVEALLLLGRTSIDLCMYEEAEHALDRAVALAERVEGEDTATLRVLALADRAALARTLGRYEEAEQRYRGALAQADPGSLDEATVANDLAVTLKFVGKLDEAECLYGRSLAILERELGPDHPDLATLFHNLGGLAHARGDYAAAEPPARRSVELRRKAFGDDHPAVAADVAALAAVLDALCLDAEAEQLFRDSIAVFERSFGPTHYEVAFNRGQLAALLFRTGRLGEAEELYRRALADLEELLGSDHPDLAPPLNNLAVLLAARGDRGAAVALHRRALAILESSVEPDHPTLLACRENLAGLGEKEEPAEAGSSPVGGYCCPTSSRCPRGTPR
jgi:tetratricopeptide (TPR) repeat protein